MRMKKPLNDYMSRLSLEFICVLQYQAHRIGCDDAEHSSLLTEWALILGNNMEQ